MDVKRCVKCVLPEGYPEVTFDENGVCNLCNSYEEQQLKDVAELENLLHSRKGEKYDCAVFLSGGRDSAYILYYVVKVFGLRAVALNYDNGFQVDQAYKNVVNACKRLECDLMEFRSRDDLSIRITNAALRTTIPLGPGPSLHFVCRHCYNGGLPFGYKTAEDLKIPFMIRGESVLEHLTYAERRKQVLGFRKPLEYALSPRALQFIRLVHLLRLQKNESLPSGNSPYSLGIVKSNNPDIQEVYLYDYVKWDPKEMEKTIERELGWQRPPGVMGQLHFDCKLHPLVNYFHIKTIGSGHNLDMLANLVRGGRMDRSWAMDLIEQGMDSDEWREEYEIVARDILKLPESDIQTMKSW